MNEKKYDLLLPQANLHSHEDRHTFKQKLLSHHSWHALIFRSNNYWLAAAGTNVPQHTEVNTAGQSHG